MRKKYIIFSSLILLAILYQNCGTGFEASSLNQFTASSLSSDRTPDASPEGGGSAPENFDSPLENNNNIFPSINLPENVDWSLKLNENFDGTGSMLFSETFEFDDLTDSLHRTGNKGMDENGNTNVEDWRTPVGKRWSVWYNKFNNDTAFKQNGHLIMTGKTTDERDPTRLVNYVDDGVIVRYGDGKIYTSWLQSWSRKFSSELNKQVVDPASKNKIYKYGFFEAKVDFSEMRTPGFRLSIWLMPAARDLAGQDTVENLSYDDDGSNGVEIDIFEYEFNEKSLKNHIIMAVYGGGAGQTSTIIEPNKHQTNLEQGSHKIGFLWDAEKMVWYINGIEVKRETNPSLIPDVYSYLVISRELNSGVKETQENPDDVAAIPPFIPVDVGLYAENAWLYKDRINSDRGKIDYIRVWQKD